MSIRQQSIEALARGKIRFDTGLPCVNGHLSQREASSRRCLACDRLAHLTERKTIGAKSKRRRRHRLAKMHAAMCR